MYSIILGKFWCRCTIQYQKSWGKCFDDILFVTTLALGLRPRQRSCKVVGQKEAQESHHILSGVWENVKEWTLTLPRQLPLWEMERDFGTPTQESRERKTIWKSHLDVGPVERCRVYYKGEGGGFPQVRAVVNLVCSCCPWLVLALKVPQLCTNHLVWVVCRPMWVSEAC